MNSGDRKGPRNAAAKHHVDSAAGLALNNHSERADGPSRPSSGQPRGAR